MHGRPESTAGFSVPVPDHLFSALLCCPDPHRELPAPRCRSTSHRATQPFSFFSPWGISSPAPAALFWHVPHKSLEPAKIQEYPAAVHQEHERAPTKEADVVPASGMLKSFKHARFLFLFLLC
jgi:hypothetical protein